MGTQKDLTLNDPTRKEAWGGLGGAWDKASSPAAASSHWDGSPGLLAAEAGLGPGEWEGGVE